jgi:DNA modification methylase
VWDYDGVNTMRPGRMDELAMQPTVKPVSLVADAIKDCSKRGGLVLDPFCGSGTILIAAEKTGRRARAIELDPVYVDVAIRRWDTIRESAPVSPRWAKRLGWRSSSCVLWHSRLLTRNCQS